MIYARPGDILVFKSHAGQVKHGLSIVVNAERSANNKFPIVTMTIINCSGSLENMTLFVDNYGYTWYLL